MTTTIVRRKFMGYRLRKNENGSGRKIPDEELYEISSTGFPVNEKLYEMAKSRKLPPG